MGSCPLADWDDGFSSPFLRCLSCSRATRPRIHQLTPRTPDASLAGMATTSFPRHI